MSNIYVVGTLGTAPELRFSSGGNAWVSVRLAVSRRVKVNGEWESETDWYNLKAFGDIAENLASTVDKGNRVLVFGTLQTERYTTKEGEEREAQTIVADEVGPDLRFATATIHRVERDGNSPRPQARSAAAPTQGFSEEPF